MDKKAAKGSDAHSSGSAGHEIPFDYDRKEKFKMVIGKSKKDGHDSSSKSNQPEVGVSLDAAAAILQAATRGIKNPGLDLFSKSSSSGAGQGSNEGGRDLSSGSQKAYCSTKPNIPVPVAKAIAETAALAAASEADSSESSLTKEQKLKAERLKRAKMFSAMIKGGSAPLETESLRGVSLEPPESGVSSSGNDVVNLATKEREGSSAPLEVDISDKVEEFDRKFSVDERNERRSKKAYRTKRLEEEDGEGEGDDDNDEEKENKQEDEKGHKHSRKKRRSHHSSDYGKDRHRHKRHSSSKDRDSRHRRKHDNSSDEKHRHSRRKHKDDSSDDEHQPSKRHKHHSSSDDEHWHAERQHTHSEHRNSRRRHKHNYSSDDEDRHSRRRHNHGSSSEDEHPHRRRSVKHRGRESEKEMELEEGEIISKSDQSIASGGANASREASVDISISNQVGRAPSQPSGTTEVSDDLRAKIRAMLMATL